MDIEFYSDKRPLQPDQTGICQTLVGPVSVDLVGGALCALRFVDRADLGPSASHADFDRIAAQIDRCWLGQSSDLKLIMRGTAFQHDVWRALLDIPFGETRSYADIARIIGRPKAVRAVGSANGANPVALLVPCHRVLPMSGGIGGYAYGSAVKERLLRAERRALDFQAAA